MIYNICSIVCIIHIRPSNSFQHIIGFRSPRIPQATWMLPVTNAVLVLMDWRCRRSVQVCRDHLVIKDGNHRETIGKPIGKWRFTIWLWHSQFATERSTMLLIGKLSMGHLYHSYVKLKQAIPWNPPPIFFVKSVLITMRTMARPSAMVVSLWLAVTARLCLALDHLRGSA
jgi:hypothetical protein